MWRIIVILSLIICGNINVYAQKQQNIKDVTTLIKDGKATQKTVDYILNEWQKNAFTDLSKEDLNIIYTICAKNVKDFHFEKYLAMKKIRREKLSPQKLRILKNKNLCLALLAMGYCQKNIASLNYAQTIKKAPFYGHFMELVANFKTHHNKAKETKIFTKDSKNKLELLEKILQDKNCFTNYYKKLKIMKLTADDVFIKQLNDNPQYKKQIIALSNSLIPEMKGKKHQEFRIEILSKLYCKLASPQEQLNWYITLLKSKNISKPERALITQRIQTLQQQIKSK